MNCARLPEFDKIRVEVKPLQIDPFLQSNRKFKTDGGVEGLKGEMDRDSLEVFVSRCDRFDHCRNDPLCGEQSIDLE